MLVPRSRGWYITKQHTYVACQVDLSIGYHSNFKCLSTTLTYLYILVGVPTIMTQTEMFSLSAKIEDIKKLRIVSHYLYSSQFSVFQQSQKYEIGVLAFALSALHTLGHRLMTRTRCNLHHNTGHRMHWGILLRNPPQDLLSATNITMTINNNAVQLR